MNKPSFSNQPSSLRVAGRIGERMAVGMQRVLATTAISDLAQARHAYTIRSVTLAKAQPDTPQPSTGNSVNPAENQ